MSATRNKFSPEFRDRAVRMVDEHRGDYPSEWAAMTSIAAKVGCTTETLRRWCRSSVGSVGDSYDNALAETINGLYKAEVIWRQRSWPSASAVEMATLRWVDWFNHHRIFGPIGHIPPAEAETNYYAANGTLDMVA